MFELKEPFNPNFLVFLRIILIIPPLPWASYLAEGDVITSTFSIASDGSCWRNFESIPTRLEGLPLIKILAASLPLNKILPSISTETDGILSKTSPAFPPLTVKSLPTVYIFLSSLISTVVSSAIISTASKDSISIINEITPRSLSSFTFRLSMV